MLEDWEKQCKKNPRQKKPQRIVKPAVVQVDFRSDGIDPRGASAVASGAAKVAGM
jgi:hypothetical protein